jgi:hypothetical protein
MSDDTSSGYDDSADASYDDADGASYDDSADAGYDDSAGTSYDDSAAANYYDDSANACYDDSGGASYYDSRGGADDPGGDSPQYPPDWQHGAPTKPVPPDPHVYPLPDPQPNPPGGPYRTPGQPSPDDGDSTWEKVTKVVVALGLSVALVATIVAALADPEPASKLALAGLSVAEIEALGTALGFATAAAAE